jgi:cation-transporting ATPase 13A1
LLSGFGNLNVKKEDQEEKKEDTHNDGARAIMSQEHLNEIRALPVGLLKMRIRGLGCDPSKYPELKEKEDLVQLYQIKARERAVKRHDKKNAEDAKKMTVAEQKAEQRRKMEEKQRAMQERVLELEAQGESWAQFKAMKEFMAQEMKEAQQKKAELSKFRGVEGQAAMLATKLDELDTGDIPMIKLGDASVAAPFTSKMPSIKNCVDIVRQGRCTLVNSMQMYQIMALECLISSYSLSVLYLDGVKYGDTQMTAMGILGSVSFMSVSRSKPLDKLSEVRPLTSIFHPAKFFSLLGQFVIHLGVMLFAVYSAKKHLPPDYVPDLDGTFQPGILNTCVFLVSSVQQVTVFVVNLQGRPFMTGLTENRPLLWSLFGTFILTFMFASETVPGLNRYFQLVPFPDEGFRDFILLLLAMDLLATFALDRLMQLLFCRDILFASVKGTTMMDVFYVARTFAVMAVVMHVFLGNSEQWDELIEMQNNMTNATANLTEGSGGIGECIDGVCDTIKETVLASVHDEF